MGKLVSVGSFATNAESAMAKSVLDSAGIECLIQSDSEGGVGPHLAWSTGGYRLLVREEDADMAHEMLHGDDEDEEE